MTVQPQLLLPLNPLPKLPPSSTLQERFEVFHGLNPHVLTAIVDVARDLRRRGAHRASISLIFERLRWIWVVQTSGDDGYRLNNSYRAFYARLAMSTAPDLVGFFETRVQRAVEGR